SLGTSVANVALPTLAEVFTASFQQVQWVVIAYLLAITTLIVGAGRLGDIVGRRRLLLAGIGLFTAASVACGAAPTLWLLIGARAAQGAGAAIMMALTMAFVGETVSKDKTGSAMGLLGTMSAVGTALGPSLGGILIAGLGWRAIFLINVPLGALALVLAYRSLPRDSRGTEAKAETSFALLAMFRNPALNAGLATSALVSTVMMATLVVGPFYLSYALGLNAAAVGMIVSVGPVVVALSGVPAGRMADRFGAQRMTVAGLIGVAAGSVAFSMTPISLGVPGYVAAIVIVTAGYALFQTANNTVVMTDIPPERRGVTSGMLNLSRNLGLIAGASVMGVVFAAASGTADFAAARPEAVATGMRVTFAVAAVLMAGALGIAAVSRRLTMRRLLRVSQ